MFGSCPDTKASGSWFHLSSRNAQPEILIFPLHTKSHFWFISGWRPDVYRLGFKVEHLTSPSANHVFMTGKAPTHLFCWMFFTAFVHVYDDYMTIHTPMTFRTPGHFRNFRTFPDNSELSFDGKSKETNSLGTRCQGVRVVLGPNVQGDQLSGCTRCHGCTNCHVTKGTIWAKKSFSLWRLPEAIF